MLPTERKLQGLAYNSIEDQGAVPMHALLCGRLVWSVPSTNDADWSSLSCSNESNQQDVLRELHACEICDTTHLLCDRLGLGRNTP